MSPPVLPISAVLSAVTPFKLRTAYHGATGIAAQGNAARQFYSYAPGLNSYGAVGILPKEGSI